MGREISRHKTYSDEMAGKIDNAVHSILDNAKKRALSILKEHRDQLDKLSSALIERETLSDNDIKELLGMLEVEKEALS